MLQQSWCRSHLLSMWEAGVFSHTHSAESSHRSPAAAAGTVGPGGIIEPWAYRARTESKQDGSRWHMVCAQNPVGPWKRARSSGTRGLAFSPPAGKEQKKI